MNSESRDGKDSLDELHRRLERLPSLIDDDPQFVHRILNRIEAGEVVMTELQSFQIRRWIMRSSMGLAAALLVGVCTWWFLFNSPRPALAMEEVSKRVLSLQSLHMKGTVFPLEGPGRPFEIFARQPAWYRVNGLGNSGWFKRLFGLEIAGRGMVVEDEPPAAKPVEEGANPPMDIIITPDRLITLVTSAKRATIVTPSDAEDARVQVEEMLQGIGQMMFGHATGFKRIRSEKSAGVSADVYESHADPQSRVDVWIDVATGLPLKSEMYVIRPAAPDSLVVRFDMIEADPTIAADVFAPTFGPEWKMTTVKGKKSIVTMTDQITFGSHELAIRYAVSLDREKVLLCWCVFDKDHPGDDVKTLPGVTSLSFAGDGGATYVQHLLHADVAPGNGFHWRWSLLSASKATAERATLITVTAKDNQGDTGSTSSTPLKYGPDELRQRVEQLQNQTLTPRQSPMTLDQILAAVKQ